MTGRAEGLQRRAGQGRGGVHPQGWVTTWGSWDRAALRAVDPVDLVANAVGIALPVAVDVLTAVPHRRLNRPGVSGDSGSWVPRHAEDPCPPREQQTLVSPELGEHTGRSALVAELFGRRDWSQGKEVAS
jgi:hypothetical protein